MLENHLLPHESRIFSDIWLLISSMYQTQILFVNRNKTFRVKLSNGPPTCLGSVRTAFLLQAFEMMRMSVLGHVSVLFLKMLFSYTNCIFMIANVSACKTVGTNSFLPMLSLPLSQYSPAKIENQLRWAFQFYKVVADRLITIAQFFFQLVMLHQQIPFRQTQFLFGLI